MDRACFIFILFLVSFGVGAEDIKVNYQDAELSAIAETVGYVINKKIVVERGVSGRITAKSDKPLNTREFFLFFCDIVKAHGYRLSYQKGIVYINSAKTMVIKNEKKNVWQGTSVRQRDARRGDVPKSAAEHSPLSDVYAYINQNRGIADIRLLSTYALSVLEARGDIEWFKGREFTNTPAGDDISEQPQGTITYGFRMGTLIRRETQNATPVRDNAVQDKTRHTLKALPVYLHSGRSLSITDVSDGDAKASLKNVVEIKINSDVSRPGTVYFNIKHDALGRDGRQTQLMGHEVYRDYKVMSSIDKKMSDVFIIQERAAGERVQSNTGHIYLISFPDAR